MQLAVKDREAHLTGEICCLREQLLVGAASEEIEVHLQEFVRSREVLREALEAQEAELAFLHALVRPLAPSSPFPFLHLKLPTLSILLSPSSLPLPPFPPVCFLCLYVCAAIAWARLMLLLLCWGTVASGRRKPFCVTGPRALAHQL